jgi:PIN domain nuclease of toxin-antitoxin system
VRLLLDSHVLVWLAERNRRTASVTAIVTDPAHDVFVSLATWWELGLKVSLGRLQFDLAGARRRSDDAGFAELPITWPHVLKAMALPHHHADPFDRLLVAQAISEGMRLVTADRALVPYSELVWCIG